MVNTKKKVDKREMHIKKKLTAAVIMLLVSCIMTVTSTYAWFTLSTAPEIKGVSTTVGANGSLEIALATNVTWQTPETITSAVGDSGKFETWGNLIDLSDAKYGLDNITLYPAKLNTNKQADGSEVVPSVILQTPIYGVDGRVKDVEANTVTGTYDGNQFNAASGSYGVRAIGRSLNLTTRQIAYRNALDSILLNQTSASSVLRTSWVNNGGHLSALAIGMAAGMLDSEVVSEAQYIGVRELVVALEKSIEYIEKSMTYAIDGYLASKKGQTGALASDDAWLLIHNELTAEGYKLLSHVEITDASTVKLVYAGSEKVDLPAEFAARVYELKQMSTDVAAAKEVVSVAYSSTGSTLGQLKGALNHLLKIEESETSSTVTISGYKPSEIKANPTLALTSGALSVELNEGSGVYYSIAKFVGNFSSNVTVPEGVEFTYGGSKLPLGGLTVVLKTNSKLPVSYLEASKSIVNNAGSPTTGDSAEALVISDTYGYVIDFLVRTNASNSNLLLQTEAKNRVSENSEDTMGSGSAMVISTIASDISTNVLKGLLDCMRVVFIDGSGVVLSEARFDTAAFTDGINVPLRIWDNATGQFAKDGEGNYVSTIVELPTNTPYKLSAIVYLDGESIDNADVSNAAQSFAGTLNLQFASSASLVPMNYSDYQELPKTAVALPEITKVDNGYLFSSLPTVGTLMYKVGEGEYTAYTTPNAVIAVSEGQTISYYVNVEDDNTTYTDSTLGTKTFTVETNQVPDSGDDTTGQGE